MSHNVELQEVAGDVRGRPALVDALLLLAITLIVRGPAYWTSLIDPDEHVFGIAGRELLHGFLPYTTLFDIKPVGSTVLVAGVFGILGDNLLSLRLLGVACVFASALLLRQIAVREGWPRPLAVCAGLLYIGFSSGMHGLATMTEIMLAPFTIGAVALILKLAREDRPLARLGLALAAGLCGGVAVLIKLVPLAPLGLTFGVVLLWMLAERRARFWAVIGVGLIFTAGCVAPFAAAAAVYWQAGLMDMFIFANGGFSAVYVGQAVELKVALRELIEVLAANWPLFAFGAFGMGAAWLATKGRRLPELIAIAAPAWLTGELVAAMATGHFYHHYFLMALPPLCLLCVLGVMALHARLGSGNVAVASAMAIALALVPAVTALAKTAPAMLGSRDLLRRTSDAILANAGGRTPQIWVTHQELVGLYLMTGSRLPTPYAQPVQLIFDQKSLARVEPAGEVRRILAERPQMIVMNRDTPLPDWASALVEPALAAGYTPVAHLPDFYVIDLGMTRRYDIWVYKRRD